MQQNNRIDGSAANRQRYNGFNELKPNNKRPNVYNTGAIFHGEPNPSCKTQMGYADAPEFAAQKPPNHNSQLQPYVHRRHTAMD